MRRAVRGACSACARLRRVVGGGGRWVIWQVVGRQGRNTGWRGRMRGGSRYRRRSGVTPAAHNVANSRPQRSVANQRRMVVRRLILVRPPTESSPNDPVRCPRARPPPPQPVRPPGAGSDQRALCGESLGGKTLRILRRGGSRQPNERMRRHQPASGVRAAVLARMCG